MHAGHVRKLLAASTALLPLAFPPQANSEVVPSITVDRIVDVIPRSLSGEVTGNSEPSIAANPGNSNQIVITSFGFGIDPTNDVLHPYFYSRDGRRTWPFVQTNLNWGDITIAWSPGGNLYAARLTGEVHAVDVAFPTLPADPPVLGAPSSGCGNQVPAGFACTAYVPPSGRLDQPWVEATRSRNTDRVYVAFNDGGKATVVTAPNAPSPTARFHPRRRSICTR